MGGWLSGFGACGLYGLRSGPLWKGRKMTTETICKLYLELAHLVPPGTKTFRELELEADIVLLRKHLELACLRFERIANGNNVDIELAIEQAQAALDSTSDIEGGGNA